jgi:hypothetical protein
MFVEKCLFYLIPFLQSPNPLSTSSQILPSLFLFSLSLSLSLSLASLSFSSGGHILSCDNNSYTASEDVVLCTIFVPDILWLTETIGNIIRAVNIYCNVRSTCKIIRCNVDIRVS